MGAETHSVLMHRRQCIRDDVDDASDGTPGLRVNTMNATQSAGRLAAQPAQQPKPPRRSGKKLDKFVVTLIEDVQVPAREPGVLMALDAKEGTAGEARTTCSGRVDDSDAQVRKLIARQRTEECRGDRRPATRIVKAAEATIGVALAEYEGSKKIRGAGGQGGQRIRTAARLQLTHERSVYQAATARVEYAVAQFTREQGRGPVAGGGQRDRAAHHHGTR